MAEVERRMMAEMDRFLARRDHAQLVHRLPQGADQMQNMFLKMFQQGFGASTDPADQVRS